MLLRKINAIISLLITTLLLGHAITASAWMLSSGSIYISAPAMPWILAGLVALHAFICINFAVSAHIDGEKRKVKSYPKMNGATVFQRISGILLIVFTLLHVAGATGAMQPPHFVHVIVPPIFFTTALAHAAVSTDKALITLGIGNARFIKAAGVIIKVMCALTLIASITGFYLYI